MSDRLWLIAQSGPSLSPIELKGEQPLLLGRHDKCELKMPANAEQVSRIHLRFSPGAAGWRVTDLNSRWGTHLNGVKLSPGQEVPLTAGDLLRLTPWTFGVSEQAAPRRSMRAVDDEAAVGTLIRRHTASEDVAADVLPLLLESADGIHAAADEKALAELVLEKACQGTGLPNAAMLRLVDAEGQIDVLAARRAGSDDSAPLFSRSLLAAASGGQVAELGESGGVDTSASIVQMRISSALCVPIMLGQAVAAYLYLDRRSSARSAGHTIPLRPGAAAFARALGRMAGLALANLKRSDMERRHALMEAEMAAGAEAQRWILPPRRGQIGGIRYSGLSRPGRFVGGDFFDVQALDDHRLAIALGDVSGKGVGASVLMTAAQGYLHAALRRSGNVQQAVEELNAFVHPRRPANRFVTMWVGIIDLAQGVVDYVDAGHGYGLLCVGGKVQWLSEGGGLPVGIDDEATYQHRQVKLGEAGRLVVVSDGIVEQLSPGGIAEGDMFGQERVAEIMEQLRDDGDAVDALLDRVIAHAGSPQLADDATVVELRW